MPELQIDAQRKKHRLSKRQVAKRMEMRYSDVFRLFRPGVNPRFQTLCRLAAAIGCKVRDLIKE